MATRAVKAIRFTVAWLLVPAAFAAVGYYVIGPKLGAPTTKKSSAPPEVTGEEGPSDEASQSKTFTAPKIEVSVKRGSTVSQRDIRRPARRKKKPEAKPAEPTGEAPSTTPPSTAPTGGGETVPVGDGL